MKKQTLVGSAIAALSLASVNSSGQTWGTSGTNLVTNNATGVGIATTTVSDKLTVNGHIGFTLKTIAQGDNRINGRSENGLVLFGNTDWSNSSGIVSHGINNGGDIKLITSGPSGTTDALSVENFDGTNFDQRFVVKKNGYVGVGVSTPLDKLSVDGDIGFKTSSSVRSIRGRSENYLELYSNVNADPGTFGNPSTCGPGLFMISNGHNGSVGMPGSFMLWSTNTSANSTAFKLVHHPYSNTYNTTFVVNNDGRVGIGTDPAEEKLYIDGDIAYKWSLTAPARVLRGNSPQNGLAIYGNTGWKNGGGIFLTGENSSFKGSVEFVAAMGSPAANETAFRFQTATSSGPNAGIWNGALMDIKKDGQVVIGNVNPVSASSYKLYVQTGILTERVRVAVNGSAEWADYVFADNYELKPLAEVEEFINENNHLPEVPSAEDVARDGIDLGKMDAKLLQKIEELTLYMIQQQKEIDALKKELKK